MSCPKTEHLLQEYFSDDLVPLASEEMEKHLQHCVECSAELEALQSAQAHLRDWKDERVPHWNRHQELFRREHRVPPSPRGLFSRLQWLPTAVSFAMLFLLIFNTTIVSNEQGFSISFGARTPSTDDFQAQLAALEAGQQEDMQALLTRVEDRLDRNNVQLLQAVLEQTQQTTAENLDRMYAYFEQQRLQDLQGLRAGFQELVDSDYQTIRSLEQLAQYVSYDGNLR